MKFATMEVPGIRFYPGRYCVAVWEVAFWPLSLLLRTLAVRQENGRFRSETRLYIGKREVYRKRRRYDEDMSEEALEAVIDSRFRWWWPIAQVTKIPLHSASVPEIAAKLAWHPDVKTLVRDKKG